MQVSVAILHERHRVVPEVGRPVLGGTLLAGRRRRPPPASDAPERPDGPANRNEPVCVPRYHREPLPFDGKDTQKRPEREADSIGPDEDYA